MKKLLGLAVITVMLCTSAVAQEHKAHKDMKKGHKEWDTKLKDELKLTSDQAVKYDALDKEYKDKIDALMNDASLQKDVQKEKKTTLKKEREARLLDILTPDQQAKYKELVEQKKTAKPGA